MMFICSPWFSYLIFSGIVLQNFLDDQRIGFVAAPNVVTVVNRFSTVAVEDWSADFAINVIDTVRNETLSNEMVFYCFYLVTIYT